MDPGQRLAVRSRRVRRRRVNWGRVTCKMVTSPSRVSRDQSWSPLGHVGTLRPCTQRDEQNKPGRMECNEPHGCGCLMRDTHRKRSRYKGSRFARKEFVSILLAKGGNCVATWAGQCAQVASKKASAMLSHRLLLRRRAERDLLPVSYREVWALCV